MIKRVGLIGLLVSVFMFFVFVGKGEAEVPVGYPWITWGEVTQSIGDTNIDKGFVLDSYAEQGIDWITFGKCTLDTFVGIKVKVSDNSNDYWNNYWGQSIGVKVVLSDKLFKKNSWSSLAFGVRYENRDYFKDGYKRDDRVVAFLQWGLGGNWK